MKNLAPKLRRSLLLQVLIIVFLTPGLVLMPVQVGANPSGGQVVVGDVNFQGLGTAILDINNLSQKAIINWQSFSIDAGEVTRINQGAGAFTLNRVISGNPSAIYGRLEAANGGVAVINTNGILVGAGGVVDVGGMMLMSTLDVDNGDFLDGGSNRFYGASTTGVSNFGTVSSSGGDVVLLGGFVKNEGQIGALNGTVAIGSGGDIILQEGAGSKISVRGSSDYTGNGIDNSSSGTISGAAVEMKAHGNVYALAINNGGAIRATGGSRVNGRALLFASGSSSSIMNTGTVQARNINGRGGEIEVTGQQVTNAGTLDASALGANDGGTVTVTGDNLAFTDTSEVKVNSVGNAGKVDLKATDNLNLGGTVDASSQLLKAGSVIAQADDVVVSAEINATGYQRGGSVKIGGDFQGIATNGISASSRTTIGAPARVDVSALAGDAGQIIVWSDGDTFFEGEARADAAGIVGNGGLIEVSGLENLTFRGLVSASAKAGKAGLVLFDPGTLRVGNNLSGVNEIANVTINNLLQGGTSVLITTQGAESDIVFVDTGIGNDRNGAIQWTNSNASFGAFAGRNVVVGTHIRTSGAGSINLIGGWSGTEVEAVSMLNGSIASPNDPPSAVSAGVGTGTDSVQDVFNYYVSTGQFGDNNGNIFVGSATMGRGVEVGSRYGDTNVAANNILVTAADTNGDNRHAQIGFRDSGQIFAPRIGTLDLNGRALELNNDPLVGIVGNDFGQERPDGMGVYAINSQGIHNGDGTLSSLTDATFIPYANHYMDTRQGNWWWQRIDLSSPDLGLGGNRPEMGAGSATNTADINLIAKANVRLQGGGRHHASAQVGHGGDSAGWADNMAVFSSTSVQNGQALVAWSQNGATADRSGMAIARLAPVNGQINVLAGVDTAAGVSINNNGVVSATLIANAGSVVVTGLQRMGSSNNPGNPEQGDASAGAPAFIGHGGVGQFGEFNGDIQVRAGGSIQLSAGSQTRAFAGIGHRIDTYHTWNPTSVANAQIRFFSNGSDFNDPLIRRGLLFAGQTNIAQALTAGTTTAGEVIKGDTWTGAATRTVGGLELSDPLTGATSQGRTGPLVVEALDGSVVSGFHGDVTVEALAGGVALQGYNTPDLTGDTAINAGRGLNTSRDNRYAKVGHGGTSAEVWNQGSGYRVDSGTDHNFEGAVFYFPLSGTETGSASVIGWNGHSTNRRLTFMTITGDISVNAGGDVSVKAGNDTFDFAQIGHGGNNLADYETSSFIAGNIDIDAGGQLIVTGGGEVMWTGLGGNNTTSRHMRSQAQVGHGGYMTGFLGYFGDINVNTGGNITVTGGAYGDNYAKIGHKGSNDWGQVGGNFTRNENFFYDGVSIDLNSSISGTSGTVTYSNGAQRVGSTTNYGIDNLSATESFIDIVPPTSKARTFDITSNTTNITINSTNGSVKLDHMDAGPRRTANQIASSATRGSRQDQMEDAYSQIGHGGNNYNLEYWRNTGTNFDDMVGNISITAMGANADLILEGGNREGMWSRVGHGFTGNNVRVGNGQEMLIGGAVTVNVGRDVFLNGEKAGEMDVNEDQPAKDNGLAIGHGAMVVAERSNRGQITVLDGGTINGLTLPSTITVNAGRDITVIGGNGAQDVVGEIGPSGTHSQIGHGAASLFGDTLSARGFQGAINVSADRDIVLRATNNGIVHDAAGSIILASSGGAAVIGNGGIHMDAPASGDITVYAGNNLSVISPQRRTDEDPNLLRLASSFSTLNFAKIGHFSTENTLSGVVQVGLMEGDISVVVGNDLTMSGGRTPDHDSLNFEDVGIDPLSGLYGRQGVVAAFSQIGHGGPGINGAMIGDIEVLVKNNMTTHDGTIDSSGQFSPLSGNNYVKIGHGDWMRDGTIGTQGPATGLRVGDIAVLVGDSADLEHAMIGHSDPSLSGPLPGEGTTTIAVGRNFPFYTAGSGGSLTATGVTDQADAVGFILPGTGVVSGTVFTSGSVGGDPLKIYLPKRDSNFMAMGSTRLNATNVFYHGNNGGGTPGGSGTFAGAADEVFLSPDLWWMSDDDETKARAAGHTTTGRFPTANGSQGGVVATVNNPGGLPNLQTLVAGAMGSSVNGSLYRGAQGGHGLSGGLYTLFYDAVSPVGTNFVAMPPPPPTEGEIRAAAAKRRDSEFIDRNQSFLHALLTGQNENELFSGVARSGEGNGSNRVEDLLDGLLGSRRDRYSEGEKAEEEARRRMREEGPVGPIGLVSYAPISGMNPYSSLSLFGGSSGSEAGDPFGYFMSRKDQETGEMPPQVDPGVSAPSPRFDPFSGSENP
jgi:filamentous hemagglutinin family protein